MNFPNTGMLNTVTKRIATSSVPGLLNASANGISNVYLTDPSLGGAFMSDMAKQIKFEEHLNKMLYGEGGSLDGRFLNLLNGDNTYDRQHKSITGLVKPKENDRPEAIQKMNEQLPQTAGLGTVQEIEDKPLITPPEQPAKPQAPQLNDNQVEEIKTVEPFKSKMSCVTYSHVIIITILVVFALYLMIQMYISQKKLEMILAMNMKQTGGRLLYS